MERSLSKTGFFQKLDSFFHALNDSFSSIVNTPREVDRNNIKNLPRSERREILRSLIEENPNDFRFTYDGKLFDIDLWMAMNKKYGPDAVSDVARSGLIDKNTLISFTKPIERNQPAAENTRFEAHLAWLEQMAINVGWKQDSILQSK